MIRALNLSIGAWYTHILKFNLMSTTKPVSQATQLKHGSPNEQTNGEHLRAPWTAPSPAEEGTADDV